jgi:hypothetical protein
MLLWLGSIKGYKKSYLFLYWIYNTHIDILKNNIIDNNKNLDIYGIIDILLFFFGISWYNFLMDKLTDKNINSMITYRISLNKLDSHTAFEMTKQMLYDYYLTNHKYNKKIYNLYKDYDFIKFISKCIQSTITIDDIYIVCLRMVK